MTRLERLAVHGFRGLVDSSLAFDCGSVVLGGGNGTGKSAFVDALEFLFTGSISTLAGTAGLSLREHGPHLHIPLREAFVEATFDTPAATARRWLSGKEDVPISLRSHLETGAGVAFILRRSQLQQFIHAKPADRYRSLADLLGVDALERVELSLKRARDTLHQSLLSAEAEAAQIGQQLASQPSEPEGDEELLQGAQRALEELGFGDLPLESFDHIPAARSSVLRRVTERRTDPRMEVRAPLLAELRRGIDQQQLRSALSAYVALVPTAREAGDRAESLLLLDILRRGREYMRHTEAHRCPLCEGEVDARELLARLMNRIGALEEVGLHRARLERAIEDLEGALQDTTNRVRSVEGARERAGIKGGSGSALLNALTMLRESVRTGALTESVEMAARVEDGLEQWSLWSEERQKELASEVPDEPEGEEREYANAALSVLQELGVRRAAVERGARERERLQAAQDTVQAGIAERRRALDLAESAYSTFNRVKNEEIQRIFDALQADLARFYDFLHPEESHGAPAIAMDPRKRGSSDLSMDFYWREAEDPRAFSSEGHLDSLGLCIFLAFVRHFNADWPLLVLDDVVTSVDATHKQRVATLLFREFGDRQLFITTHDARWFNDLRRAQTESGRAGSTRNLVIESWNLDEGPRIRQAS